MLTQMARTANESTRAPPARLERGVRGCSRAALAGDDRVGCARMQAFSRPAVSYGVWLTVRR